MNFGKAIDTYKIQQGSNNLFKNFNFFVMIIVQVNQL